MTARTAQGQTPTHARTRVLETFHTGAAQITEHERFTRHRLPNADVDWDGVLAEPDWSPGQRVLIQLAAALCGHGQLPSGSLGAHLTGAQTDLVLAMCQAARG